MSDPYGDETNWTSDQSLWPAHLRDDAPSQRCNRCGRQTVDTAQFGTEDRMRQPDGGPCGGRFGATAVSDDLSVKAVYEKLNALPPRDRADARWVMSWATLEALCALHARPKPIPGVAVTLVGLPIDLDETTQGVELRARPPAVAAWSPGNVTPAP